MCLLAALLFGAEVATAAPALCLVEGAVAEETAGASEAEEVLFAAPRAEMTEEDVAPVCAAGGRKTGRELAAAVAAAAAFKAAFFFFCRARFEARFKARLTKNSFSSAGSPD